MQLTGLVSRPPLASFGSAVWELWTQTAAGGAACLSAISLLVAAVFGPPFAALGNALIFLTQLLAPLLKVNCVYIPNISSLPRAGWSPAFCLAQHCRMMGKPQIGPCRFEASSYS